MFSVIVPIWFLLVGISLLYVLYDALFRLPLARAQAAGVETPRLAALCDLLAELDNRRKDSGLDAA